MKNFSKFLIIALLIVGLSPLVSYAEKTASSSNILAATYGGRIDEVTILFDSISTSTIYSGTFAVNGVDRLSIQLVDTSTLASASNSTHAPLPSTIRFELCGSVTKQATPGICEPFVYLNNFGVHRNIDVSGYGTCFLKCVPTVAPGHNVTAYIRLTDRRRDVLRE